MKKVRKTTKPFRYDYIIILLYNQICYDYTVDVINRFKALDLVDRVSEELWMEICNMVQEAVNKIIPKKNKGEKAKRLSEEALQIAKLRRQAECRGERERYIQLNAEIQRTEGEIRKLF